MDQLNTMNLLMGDLNDVSDKESTFMIATQSMDNDLANLGAEIVAADELGEETHGTWGRLNSNSEYLLTILSFQVLVLDIII